MNRIIIFSGLNLWSIKKGSGAVSFYKTVQGYVNAGWDTYLIQSGNGETESQNDYQNLKQYVIRMPMYQYSQLRKIGYFIRCFQDIYVTHQYYVRASKILNNQDNLKNTILYAYENDGVRAAKKLSKKYHLPLVTRFQGTILCDRSNTIINRIRLHKHYAALSTSADLIIMTNDGTKGDRVLKQLGNYSKSLFWLNGLDFQQSCGKDKPVLEGQIQKGDKVLMTICRLTKWKRVDRAITALQKVVIQFPKVKLVIVGDGDARQELEHLVLEMGLKDHVLFEGAQPHELIDSYIKRADIFLSLYDLSNLGNPLFEAMANGKPIITLNVGDTASIIRNHKNGILLEPKDLDNLPAEIIKLMRDPKEARRLGNNAKKYIKKNFVSWNQRIQNELIEVQKLLPPFM